MLLALVLVLGALSWSALLFWLLSVRPPARRSQRRARRRRGYLVPPASTPPRYMVISGSGTNGQSSAAAVVVFSSSPPPGDQSAGAVIPLRPRRPSSGGALTSFGEQPAGALPATGRTVPPTAALRDAGRYLTLVPWSSAEPAQLTILPPPTPENVLRSTGLSLADRDLARADVLLSAASVELTERHRAVAAAAALLTMRSACAWLEGAAEATVRARAG